MDESSERPLPGPGPGSDAAEPTENQDEARQEPPGRETDDAAPPPSAPVDAGQLDEPLFVVGGKVAEGVPGPTRERDFGVSSPDDVIGAHEPPTSPQDEIPGRSMYTSPEAIQAQDMSGQVFEFTGPLPEGTAIHRDGSDVGGEQPDGHRSLYPTRPMTLGEFDQSLREPSRWEHWGKIDKKGNIRKADEE